MSTEMQSTGQINLTDLEDMRMQVPFTRQALTTTISDLDNQLTRTFKAYGPERNNWPASSEMMIRDLEDRRDNLGGRLQREEQYLAELEN